MGVLTERHLCDAGARVDNVEVLAKEIQSRTCTLLASKHRLQSAGLCVHGLQVCASASARCVRDPARSGTTRTSSLTRQRCARVQPAADAEHTAVGRGVVINATCLNGETSLGLLRSTCPTCIHAHAVARTIAEADWDKNGVAPLLVVMMDARLPGCVKDPPPQRPGVCTKVKDFEIALSCAVQAGMLSALSSLKSGRVCFMSVSHEGTLLAEAVMVQLLAEGLKRVDENGEGFFMKVLLLDRHVCMMPAVEMASVLSEAVAETIACDDSTEEKYATCYFGYAAEAGTSTLASSSRKYLLDSPEGILTHVNNWMGEYKNTWHLIPRHMRLYAAMLSPQVLSMIKTDADASAIIGAAMNAARVSGHGSGSALRLSHHAADGLSTVSPTDAGAHNAAAVAGHGTGNALRISHHAADGLSTVSPTDAGAHNAAVVAGHGSGNAFRLSHRVVDGLSTVSPTDAGAHNAAAVAGHGVGNALQLRHKTNSMVATKGPGDAMLHNAVINSGQRRNITTVAHAADPSVANTREYGMLSNWGKGGTAVPREYNCVTKSKDLIKELGL